MNSAFQPKNGLSDGKNAEKLFETALQGSRKRFDEVKDF